MVILSYLRLCVKRFQEPQCSIFKKISQHKREFNADSVFGKDFTAALQNDVDAIEHYAIVINEEYSNAHDAFQDFVLDASTQAQKFVKDNEAAFKSVTKWFRMGKKFKKQARLERLGESTASSFEGAVNAIRLYNEGTEKAGFTTEEFHETVAKFNPTLEAYISMMDAKGKKPTEFGYWKLTHKATVETAIFTASITAGTAALGLLAQKGNTTAAQVVGGLTAVGGAIAGVVSAIQLAKGALSLTTGFGIISAGISAVIAGISAFQTASARMREAWQADIDQLEQFKQSSEELTEAYTNVSKYLTALKNGEDVGDDLNDAVTALNKALGDNKVQFDEASMSAEEYAKRVAQSTKEALEARRMKATEARASAEKALNDASYIKILGVNLPGTAGGNFAPSLEYDYESVNEIAGGIYTTPEHWNDEGLTFEQRNSMYMDWYATLVKTRDALARAEDSNGNKWYNSVAYDKIDDTIKKMETSINALVEARYQEEKLNYEIANGIPTTKDEYDQLTASLTAAAEATGSEYLKRQMLM